MLHASSEHATSCNEPVEALPYAVIWWLPHLPVAGACPKDLEKMWWPAWSVSWSMTSTLQWQTERPEA